MAAGQPYLTRQPSDAAGGSTNLRQLIENSPLLLLEAAIVEQLRRNPGVALHQRLLNAPLIYDARGRQKLARLYRPYHQVALSAGLPFLMCTPTWRANRQRVRESGVEADINGDAVRFMQNLRKSWGTVEEAVLIGGLMGCKHDCYWPDLGLSRSDSVDFHRWQVKRLAAAGADFLIAETLPSLTEARGIADAMAETGLPYIISVVIGRNGRMLDGTNLADASASIDTDAARQPLGYMVNCAHPSFLCADRQPATLFKRLIGYQANASSLDHCELDGAAELRADDCAEWGRQMRELNRRYHVKILGGCCGTSVEHLQQLIAV